MSTLIITIELGNDAMEDGFDAYQAIAQSNIPHHTGHPSQDNEGSFRDANGNTVGAWAIRESNTIGDLDSTDDSADWVTVGHMLDAHEVRHIRELILPIA